LYVNTVLNLEIVMFGPFTVLQEMKSVPCNESPPVHKHSQFWTWRLTMLEPFIVLQELESVPCIESPPVHKHSAGPGDFHSGAVSTTTAERIEVVVATIRFLGLESGGVHFYLPSPPSQQVQTQL
jgi:hypothetical protein